MNVSIFRYFWILRYSTGFSLRLLDLVMVNLPFSGIFATRKLIYHIVIMVRER